MAPQLDPSLSDTTPAERIPSYHAASSCMTASSSASRVAGALGSSLAGAICYQKEYLDRIPWPPFVCEYKVKDNYRVLGYDNALRNYHGVSVHTCARRGSAA